MAAFSPCSSVASSCPCVASLPHSRQHASRDRRQHASRLVSAPGLAPRWSRRRPLPPTPGAHPRKQPQAPPPLRGPVETPPSPSPPQPLGRVAAHLGLCNLESPPPGLPPPPPPSHPHGPQPSPPPRPHLAPPSCPCPRSSSLSSACPFSFSVARSLASLSFRSAVSSPCSSCCTLPPSTSC